MMDAQTAMQLDALRIQTESQAQIIEELRRELGRLADQQRQFGAAPAAAQPTMQHPPGIRPERRFIQMNFAKDLKPEKFTGDGDQKGKFRSWSRRFMAYLNDYEIDGCVMAQLTTSTMSVRASKSIEH